MTHLAQSADLADLTDLGHSWHREGPTERASAQPWHKGAPISHGEPCKPSELSEEREPSEPCESSESKLSQVSQE